MMKKQCYKEMLRDRCPEVVNFALKWCKAKQRWIDHAYDHFIKIVGEETSDGKVVKTKKDNKKQVARILLGLKKGKTTQFDFDKTIDWENLPNEESNYWNWVRGWIIWFSNTYAYIENDYCVSRKTGKYSENSFKTRIEETYLHSLSDDTKTKLSKFLLTCIEGKIALIMYGVFSNYLMQRYAKRPEDTIVDVLDHMNELSKSKSKFEYDPVTADHHVICIGPLVQNESFVDGKYIYECITNRHFILLTRWINKNIILDIFRNKQLHMYTTEVRIRIASCMLNSLVDKKLLSKSYAEICHEILVANVTDLTCSFLDDSLPFL